METLQKRLADLRQKTARVKHYVMLLEKIAADLLEDAQHAGDTEVYRDAVLYQRAGHIAYEVLDLEPDILDIGLGAHPLQLDPNDPAWLDDSAPSA